MRYSNNLRQAGLVSLATVALVASGACSSAQPFENSVDGEVIAGGDTSAVATSGEEPGAMEVTAGGAETDAAGAGTDGIDTSSTIAGGDPASGGILADDGTPAVTVPGWAADGSSEEEVGIQTFYNEALQTVQARDGDAAVALTSPTTRAWADEMLALTVGADEDQLVDAPLSSSVTAIFLRSLLPEADLLAMTDGDELVAAAVDSGVVFLLLQSAAGTGNTSQGELVVEGDEAFNEVAGQRMMRFERIDGQWTFDLSHSLIVAFDSGGPGQPEDRLMTLQLMAGAAGQGRTWDDLSAPLG